MNDYFLADDLSGALDAAAAFQRAGRRILISLSSEAWPDARPGDVIGCTTETRNARPADAAAAVTRALRHGSDRGGRLLYKKIDSTLRGPVAAELAALRAARPDARILFAPANPRVGRTVQQGSLLVHGIPVAASEFGRDPVWPVRESSLRTLLGVAPDAPVVTPDTQTEADLEAAVARMEAEGGSWVPVGSGALARAVSSREAERSSTVGAAEGPAARGEPEVLPAGPVLMLGGSAHPLNRAQAARLKEARGVPVQVIAAGDPGRTVDAALAALEVHGAATLLAPVERQPAGEALRAIVDSALAVVIRGGATRLFVTGGETAFALAVALGLSTLEFRAEIEAGLALARSGEGAGARWWAVKPGGFGDVQTWVRAFDALRGSG